VLGIRVRVRRKRFAGLPFAWNSCDVRSGVSNVRGDTCRASGLGDLILSRAPELSQSVSPHIDAVAEVCQYSCHGPYLGTIGRRPPTRGRIEDMAKKHLTCPCGAAISGTNEDDLVEKVQLHLKDSHPDLNYSRDEILFLAY
jgi:hypothetical protein